MKLTIRGRINREYSKVKSWEFDYQGDDLFLYVNGEKLIKWNYDDPYDADYFGQTFNGYLNGNLPSGDKTLLHLYLTFYDDHYELKYDTALEKFNKFMDKWFLHK